MLKIFFLEDMKTLQIKFEDLSKIGRPTLFIIAIYSDQ